MAKPGLAETLKARERADLSVLLFVASDASGRPLSTMTVAEGCRISKMRAAWALRRLAAEGYLVPVTLSVAAPGRGTDCCTHYTAPSHVGKAARSDFPEWMTGPGPGALPVYITRRQNRLMLGSPDDDDDDE